MYPTYIRTPQTFDDTQLYGYNYDGTVYVPTQHTRVIQPTKPQIHYKLSANDKHFYKESQMRADFDECEQLSHDSFPDKGAAAYKCSWGKGQDKQNEVIRIFDEERKKDTCDLTEFLFEEQSKPRRMRDCRVLKHFPEIMKLDHDEPLQIVKELYIKGVVLGDFIHHYRGTDRFCTMAGLWRQMCSGVEFLHDHGFTHNDLSIDNIMVEDGRVLIKIIDFDSAVNIFDARNPCRFVDDDGTVLHDFYRLQLYQKDHYKAREIWKVHELVSTGHSNIYLDLKSTEVAALIIIFWEMLTRCAPPVDKLNDAKTLAEKFYHDGLFGYSSHLCDEFVKGFEEYEEAIIEACSSLDDQEDGIGDKFLEDLVSESLVDSSALMESPAQLPNGMRIWKVRVENRKTVRQLLELDWIHTP